MAKTDAYERRIIQRIRASITTRLSDASIIDFLWVAYEKWQFYPLGYMSTKGPWRHHAIGDEPEDDWFISRIADIIWQKRMKRE